MGRQTELDIGRAPCSRRIFRLWTRRETVDCITQVGSSDPLRGATVIAINTSPRVQTLKIRREFGHCRSPWSCAAYQESFESNNLRALNTFAVRHRTRPYCVVTRGVLLGSDDASR
jgi:hypothetical protein